MEKQPEPKGKTVKFEDVSNLKVGEQSNTFRLGDDWKDRVKAGDKVKLVSAVDNSVLGEAEIVAVYGGKWADVKNLAADNHMFANRPTQIGGLAAQEMLSEELVRLYPDAKPAEADLYIVYFTVTSLAGEPAK